MLAIEVQHTVRRYRQKMGSEEGDILLHKHLSKSICGCAVAGTVTEHFPECLQQVFTVSSED